MRVLFTLAVAFVLAACQSTVDGSATRSQSSGIASATATDAGIQVVTTAGNRHTFQRREVCGGQTWMRVGNERFRLTQQGTTVRVDGAAIHGLTCPPRATGGGGGNATDPTQVAAPGQQSWSERPDLVDPSTGEVRVGEDEVETAPADESPSYAPPALSG